MSDTTSRGALFHERARVAAYTRSRPDDDPDLLDARRKLKALTLEEHVRKVVAQAPALTAEQKAKISALLFTEPTAS
jgi:hypothetical protein